MFHTPQNLVDTLTVDQLLPAVQALNPQPDPGPHPDDLDDDNSIGVLSFDCPVCGEAEGVLINYTRETGIVTELDCNGQDCLTGFVLEKLGLPAPPELTKDETFFDEDGDSTPYTPNLDPDDLSLEEMRESYDRWRHSSAATDDEKTDWLNGILDTEMYRKSKGLPPHEGVLAFIKELAQEKKTDTLTHQAASLNPRAMEELLAEFEQPYTESLAQQIAPPFTGTTVPVKWVIPDWLELGTVTLLAGKGGVGKSRLALQTAVQLALGGGRYILGDGAPLFRTAKQARTLYLSWEDDGHEYHRRLAAHINPGSAPDANTTATMKLVDDCIHFADLRERGPLWEPHKGGGGHIATKGEETNLFKQVAEYAAEYQTGLVVVDTVAAAYLGDENIRTLVRSFVTALSVLANQTGAAILLVTHPSKSSDVSGSTDWENACRTVWQLQREGDGLLLVHRKANHAPIQDSIYLDGQHYPYHASEMPEKLTESGQGAIKLCKGYMDYTCDVEVAGRVQRCPDCKSKHDHWRKHDK